MPYFRAGLWYWFSTPISGICVIGVILNVFELTVGTGQTGGRTDGR